MKENKIVYYKDCLWVDDLVDKEVAEKLSKEVVSYIIEQVTKNERN